MKVKFLHLHKDVVIMEEKRTSDRHCSEQMVLWETTNKLPLVGFLYHGSSKKAASTAISINYDPELDLKFHG